MHVMQVAGAEVLVRQIIETMGNRLEPTIFCLDAVGTIGEELQEKGVPVIALDRKPGIDWQLLIRLGSEIAKRQIQVLHAHQYTPFFYSALAKLRSFSSTKILFTEHGRHYPDIVSPKRRWFNKLLLRRLAAGSTACCDFSTEAVRQIEGFPQTVTLRNGVDLTNLPARGTSEQQQALREALVLDLNRKYVACIARFHPVKDHPTLIRAWKHVSEQMPDARLLLVGDGEERQNCERLAADLGISEHIEFWGIRKDVADILRAVDGFALSSISEAASLTLLEAMASECPVVLTDVGGNAEHATHGEHGYLVPRGDHVAMGAAIVDLLEDPTRGKEMGTAARKRVVENFDLKQIIEAYSNTYTQLAAY